MMLFASFRQTSLIRVVLGCFRESVRISCDSRDKPCHIFQWRKWGATDKNDLFLSFSKIAVTSVTFVTTLKNTVYQLVNEIKNVTVIFFVSRLSQI